MLQKSENRPLPHHYHFKFAQQCKQCSINCAIAKNAIHGWLLLCTGNLCCQCHIMWLFLLVAVPTWLIVTGWLAALLYFFPNGWHCHCWCSKSCHNSTISMHCAMILLLSPAACLLVAGSTAACCWLADSCCFFLNILKTPSDSMSWLLQCCCHCAIMVMLVLPLYHYTIALLALAAGLLTLLLLVNCFFWDCCFKLWHSTITSSSACGKSCSNATIIVTWCCCPCLDCAGFLMLLPLVDCFFTFSHSSCTIPSCAARATAMPLQL